MADDTPDLTAAIINNDVDAVRAAIDAGVEVEQTPNPHGSLLIWASEWGRTEIVRLLVDTGVAARPEALHWAACRGHTETVRLLLDAGCDPNAGAYWPGWTALHSAAEYPSVVALLLQRGADATAVSGSGDSPLASKTPFELAKERAEKLAQALKSPLATPDGDAAIRAWRERCLRSMDLLTAAAGINQEDPR